MTIEQPKLCSPDVTGQNWGQEKTYAWSEKLVRQHAEAYLQKYLSEREPVAWAYRAFAKSEFITLTMDKDDLSIAVDGVIPLYE